MKFNNTEPAAVELVGSLAPPSFPRKSSYMPPYSKLGNFNTSPVLGLFPLTLSHFSPDFWAIARPNLQEHVKSEPANHNGGMDPQHCGYGCKLDRLVHMVFGVQGRNVLFTGTKTRPNVSGCR